MNLLHYEKEIWASKYKEIAPVLLGLLTSKDCLVVLTHGKAPYRVIFGVPHQAAVGTPIICEKSNNGKGRASDENAASFALVAFSLLKDHDIPCKLVIAAHPTNTDPNKDVNSDYCKEVFREPAELLFECHGAKSQRKLDLELSAGQNALSDRKAFGEFVASTLKNQYTLGVQKEKGSSKALVFGKDGKNYDGVLENPATETLSLIEAQNRKIPALHIEAKPQFRIPAKGVESITPDGLVLGKGLAQAVMRC